MKVGVLGATGYIGGRLVPELLGAGHQVVCIARSPEKLARRGWIGDVEVRHGDALDVGSLTEAVAGVDVLYHLVHSMGEHYDFADAERRTAANVRDAATDAGVSHVIYLGGLGDDDDPGLSAHLRSRHEVGRIIGSGTVPTTELRAAIIIGSGSASFEMLRSLVEVLPVMITPRWVNGTRCQPIAIADVLHYLVAVLDHVPDDFDVYDVGGPEVATYRQMMDRYAEVAGLPRRVIVPVPVLTPLLSSHWINIVTPLPVDLARPLIESQVNDVVVRPDHDIGRIVDHAPLGLAPAIGRALRKVRDLETVTRWSDSASGRPAEPYPGDPDWSGGTLLVDDRSVDCAASPDEVFGELRRIGGDHGWYASMWAWRLRGLVDKLVGGPGMRRGRRHPDQLRVGDTVDFFRVEALDDGHRLRLRAEMKVPGEAWLEWEVAPNPTGSVLRQRALFHPRGLLGRLYWYALIPAHARNFDQLLRGVADAAAEVRPAAT
jgi:uncharacterized protein YbjT (DUF2867 family)